MRFLVIGAGLLVALLAAHNTMAQLQKKRNTSGYGRSKNLPTYDDRVLRYGFQLAIHQSRFNIRYSDFFANSSDSTTGVRPQWSPGFMLGLITSFRLGNELWNLRFVPNVSFYERNIEYQYRNDPENLHNETYENTFVELPFLLKYKSLRRGNHRMYMVGGVSANFKVAGRKERLNDLQLQTANQNLEICYGLGWDLYFEFFKFAPELRFSHGVPNLLINNGNRVSNSLSRLTTHRVTLILNFE
ncbi:type IX secretion/gliding motility protein PorT/SprT [Rhodoflexus sp.]